MRVKALCVSDDAGEYDGKRGHTKYQQLALLDQDPVVESRMVNTFDYRMSESERTTIAGKCQGKIVIIDVKDFELFNSRLKVKVGKIFEVVGLNAK